MTFAAVDAAGDAPVLVVSNTAPVPQPPSDLAATAAGSDRIDLTWAENSGDETGFMVERSTDGQNFAPVAYPPVNATRFSDTGLAEGTTYLYRVTATSGDGPAPGGAGAAGMASAATFPAAPAALTAGATSATSVHLGWVDRSTHETGFVIARSSDGATYARVAVAPADATAFDDATAAEGSTYTYLVLSTVSPLSGESAPAHATAATPPAAPGDVTASADAADGVTVHWTNHSAAPAGFDVQRSDDFGVSFTVVGHAGAADASFTDASVRPDTPYAYRVVATGPGGPSMESNSWGVVTPTTAPTALAATAGSPTRVSLAWAAPAGATGYVVERSDHGGAFAPIAGTDAGQTAYDDDTATEGTAYAYRVRATNGGGQSLPAAPASATTPPASPTDLTATAGGAGVTLDWVDKSAGESGYRVDRSADGGRTWSPLVETGPGATSYTDAAAAELTAYQFRVRAFGPGGESDSSLPAAVATPLARPTLLTATASGPEQVDLAWSDNSGSEEGYEVERAAGGQDFQPLASLPAGAAGFSDTFAADGTAYTYRVRAAASAGDSDYSDTAFAATPLAAPTDLVATPVLPTEVDLAWAAHSATATGYAVYRAPAGGAFERLGSTGPTASGFSDTHAAPGTAYTYRVAAVSPAGTSDPSNDADATTP